MRILTVMKQRVVHATAESARVCRLASSRGMAVANDMRLLIRRYFTF